MLQTSHVTPQQAGGIFAAAQPRLAVAHHLTVNDASRAAIIQDIRQGYPKVRALAGLQVFGEGQLLLHLASHKGILSPICTGGRKGSG